MLIGQTATNPWTITAWAYEDSNGTSDYVATYGRILVIDDGTAFQLESGASGDGELYTWARANTQWQVPWGMGSTVAPLLDQCLSSRFRSAWRLSWIPGCNSHWF